MPGPLGMDLSMRGGKGWFALWQNETRRLSPP